MINIRNKPLTPHLTIYKTENSSLYSIWHRITGVFLLIFFCSNSLLFKFFNWEINLWWNYNLYDLIVNYNIIIIFLICLFFHVLNGIRYLTLNTNIYYKIFYN